MLQTLNLQFVLVFYVCSLNMHMPLAFSKVKLKLKTHSKTHALVGTPLGVSKFDFSGNFVSRNSAQIQNFTRWHCRGVNLVDCSVICIERNQSK